MGLKRIDALLITADFVNIIYLHKVLLYVIVISRCYYIFNQSLMVSGWFVKVMIVLSDNVSPVPCVIQVLLAKPVHFTI